MICLIAGTKNDAKKWARGQNLGDEEWFHGETLFHIYAKKNFHTIIVPDGIENLSNNDMNRLLTAAWECGRRGR
jgi:hypothetical protein